MDGDPVGIVVRPMKSFQVSSGTPSTLVKNFGTTFHRLFQGSEAR